MPLLALLPLITALAPHAAKLLGSALGGGEGKRIAAAIEPAVTEAAVRVFGTEDPEQATREARRDPTRAEEFAREMAAVAAQAQALAAQMRIEEIKLELSSVQGAREHQQKLAGMGNIAAHGANVISMVVVLGFFGILALMVWRPFTLDAINSQILNIMIGVLASSFTGVVSYWIGSSRGSTLKDQSAADQLSKVVDALGKEKPVVVSPAPAPATPPPPVVVVPSVATPPVPPTPQPAQPPKESRFTSVIGDLLRHEGGYVDDPDDPGGCTHRGITLRTLRDWRPGETVTCNDVRALTESEARQIYYAKYYAAVQGDSLPVGLDRMVFDFAVNAGVHRSAKTLQQCLQKRDATLAIDGAIGPLTLAVVARTPVKALIDEFHNAKMAFYQSLPHWPKYGNGWTARAEDVLTKARAEAAASS